MSNDVPELTDVPPVLQAAIKLWERLAAYAWEQTLALGRGVVLVDEHDLLEAADDGANDTLRLSFVAMLEVPSGDDFLHVIRTYDIKRQIVLLVGRSERTGADDDEQLFVLEASEDGRALPEECFYALQERR